MKVGAIQRTRVIMNLPYNAQALKSTGMSPRMSEWQAMVRDQGQDCQYVIGRLSESGCSGGSFAALNARVILVRVLQRDAYDSTGTHAERAF
jgi:hypothetical protein